MRTPVICSVLVLVNVSEELLRYSFPLRFDIKVINLITFAYRYSEKIYDVDEFVLKCSEFVYADLESEYIYIDGEEGNQLKQKAEAGS